MPNPQLFNQFLPGAEQAGANTATDDEVARKREEEMTARRLQQSQVNIQPPNPNPADRALPSETFKAPEKPDYVNEMLSLFGKAGRIEQGEKSVNKSEFADYLKASAYDAAKKADRDPLEVANTWYKEISPARRFLMDFARGFMLDRSPQPLETVREELLRKAMMQQSVAQKRKDSSVAALQNLINQEAMDKRNTDRLNTQVSIVEIKGGIQSAMHGYGIEAGLSRELMKADQQALKWREQYALEDRDRKSVV